MTRCNYCHDPILDPYVKHIPAGYASGEHDAAFCCLKCWRIYLEDLAKHNRESFEHDHNPTSPDALLELGPAD